MYKVDSYRDDSFSQCLEDQCDRRSFGTASM